MTEKYVSTEEDVKNKQKKLGELIAQLDKHLERSTHKEPTQACHRCVILTSKIRISRYELQFISLSNFL